MSRLTIDSAPASMPNVDADVDLDSDCDSAYEPSLPDTSSLLSYDSDASMTSDVEDAAELEDETKGYPPLTLSALVAGSVETPTRAGFGNPFVDIVFNNAWSAINAPFADKTKILSDCIKVFERNEEKKEEILNVACHDQVFARIVIDRYAETQGAIDTAAQKDVNFAPHQAEVETVLLQNAGTHQSGMQIRDRLLRQIDLYVALVPRDATFNRRKDAMVSIAMIGEGALGARPSEVKAALFGDDILAGKINMALAKLITDLKRRETGKKEIGYIKRTGLATRLSQLIAALGQQVDIGQPEWLERIA